MEIPVYDMEGNEVCKQYRIPGKPPRFLPRGIPVKHCQPYVERLLSDGIVLACEGPTDAMSAGKLEELRDHSIVAAWSSTTLGARDWWIRNLPQGKHSLVACGDNDLAGKAFNQSMANLMGSCHVLHWPHDRPKKWDVKDEIDSYGANGILALISRSLSRSPLNALQKQETLAKGTFKERAGIISQLVAEAGGRMAYRMHEGEKWFCPLHDDREDASLTVNDETGAWCCWAGCGRGGPVQFVMAWRGMSYGKALLWLQARRIT